MKLAAYVRQDGTQAIGAVHNDELVDLTSVGLPPTIDELLSNWPDALVILNDAFSRSSTRVAINAVQLLPPLAKPGKALAVGLNYVDHAAEGNTEPPAYPTIFPRYPSSWVGHREPLVLSPLSVAFDYEAEVVVVIGKTCRGVSREQALDYVAGYSLFNDGTYRDYQFRTTQWLVGKNFDASGSFGPWLVTADELPAGAAGLDISCSLNGTIVQQANTRDLIFDVPTLIASCSETMTLDPGDIIITGTPAGVGWFRDPKILLRPGDVCEVFVPGIGSLVNEIVSAG